MSAILTASSDPPRAARTTRIRLWDLPVRLFHWSLVVAVATAVVTGELGGSWMALHGRAGLAIAGLVVFRLVWGLIGSTHARFAQFVPTPRSLLAHLRGRWAGVGHNPLGALSVIALLALLAAQAATGLFSNDDIAFTGPLFARVDEAVSGRLTGIHKQLANVLLALIALHVVAIACHFAFKKDNLVKPMLTGWKEIDDGHGAGVDGVTEHVLTRRAESAGTRDAHTATPWRGGLLAFAISVAVASAAVLAVSGALGPAPPPAAAVSAPTPAW